MDFDLVFADCIRSEADLFDDQREAIEFAWEHPFSALYLDVGKGKTVISYSIIDRLWCRGYTGKFLIIAPIRVANRTWPFEPRLWRQLAYMTTNLIRVADDDPRLKAAYQQGYAHGKKRGYEPDMCRRIAIRSETKHKYEILESLVDNEDQIHIINREAVSWLVELMLKRGSWPYRVVFFDEASVLGDHNNEVYKAMKKVMPFVKRFHELTASPASQTYMRYFSQIWLLDKGERFGNHITPFRERFFSYNHYNRTYTIRDGAAEEIERLIADIVLVQRRDKNFQVSVRNIRLSPELMKGYRDFERDLILELPPDRTIDAVNAAVLAGKLIQYSSGAVYDREVMLDELGDPVLDSRGVERMRRFYHVLHDEKIEELKSLVDETLDEPILVSYWFKSSLERLIKTFPRAAVMDAEGKVEADWNKRKFKMLFVHPQNAAHGLNLQFGGHHLCVFDLFYSLELFTQLIGRLDRQGQIKTVMVHLLSVTGGMDEVVAARLQSLQDAQEAMFKRLQDLRKQFRG